MAQVYGRFQKTGQTTEWRPIEAEEVSPGVFALKTIGSGGATGTSGVAEHHNAAANIAVATVNFSASTKHVQVENRSVNTIFVSFDGGTNTRTIDSGITLDVDAITTSIEISANVNGSTYEIIALV